MATSSNLASILERSSGEGMSAMVALVSSMVVPHWVSSDVTLGECRLSSPYTSHESVHTIVFIYQ